MAVVLGAGLVLGAGYGWLSALRNSNPYAEPGAVSAATLGERWGWRPSPAWLPSYVLCVGPRNGYGISRTRSGYLFRTQADRAKYTVASALLGGVMGVLAAACGRAATMELARKPAAPGAAA